METCADGSGRRCGYHCPACLERTEKRRIEQAEADRRWIEDMRGRHPDLSDSKLEVLKP